jgi:hypothetical protein
MKSQPLTKSRYRLGIECPTKIHYAMHPDIYQNRQSDDAFLKSLAEGGFQVAELAKRMFPGHMIETLDRAAALAHTASLLGRGDTTIHEAAFAHGGFFIRSDILIKTGNDVELIEVKSKSHDLNRNDKSIITSRNAIRSDWLPYIHDIAFQMHVIGLAHPEWRITPCLLLVNRAARAPLDGVNSLFLCRRDSSGNPHVETPHGVPDAVLDAGMLMKHDVSEAVAMVLAADYDGESFAGRAERWAQATANDTPIAEPIGATKCAGCQFRATAEERAGGRLSGFHECWKPATGLNDEQLDAPLVLEIWNYRRKQELLAQRLFLLRDVNPDAHIPDGNAAPPASGWSDAERQRIQIRCAKDGNESTPVVDTTRCALPFHKGEAPYGNIAFQFSHHQLEADGTLHHAHEWICLDRGVWPNAMFSTALRDAIGGDDGTILHYAQHERTVLEDIAESLENHRDTHAERDLACWIRSILVPADEGGRMVDMRKILQRHYYHPLTRGSNSLKAVLPAILRTNPFLTRTYSAPDYGTPMMPSRNFSRTAWITPENPDPYDSLPPMESTAPNDRFFNDDSIREGGAAMTAYAKCQFSQITPEEVTSLRAALLMYCELDTLAMAMLWQTWKYDHCT